MSVLAGTIFYKYCVNKVSYPMHLRYF